MKALDVDKFARRWCTGIFVMMYSLANICRTLFQAQVSYYTDCGVKIEAKFQQPIFVNIIMSLSMVPAIFVDIIHKKCKATQEASTKIPTSIWLLIPLTSLLDIIQCWSMNRAMSNVGLSFASLIVAFDLLFISLIKTFVLKIPMSGYAIFSVVIVIISIVLIALSDHLSGVMKFNFNDSNTISVLIIQIFGEICRSILFVIEESIVHNTDMTPEVFVASIGLFDFLISLFIQTPISYFLVDPSWGSFYENICNSLELLFHSKTAICACFTYLICSFIMNIANTRYIYYTGAIQTSICSGFSAAVNWLIGVFAGTFAEGTELSDLTIIFPEKWSNWSIMKIVCYLAILFALCVFSRVFDLPCFEYPEESRYVVSMDDIEH